MTAEEVITKSTKILEAMKANPDMKMKDVSMQSIQADCATLSTTMQQMAALEVQLTPLRNQRIDLINRLTDSNSRALAGFKSFYGPDSSQYESAGGTRKSERKKPARKTSTPALAGTKA